MANKLQIRRDSEFNWTALNPILADGELIYVSTLGNRVYDKEKIGNGVDNYSTLPYKISGGGGSITSVTGSTPIAVTDGNTPNITILAATLSDAGSMSATDKTKLDSATNANTANQIVKRDSSGNFSAATITASLTGISSKASNIVGGQAGYIPYQTAVDTTSLLEKGTAGQVLTMNSGATAPQWSTPADPADNSITNAKLANVASGTIKGRSYTGTGVVHEICAISHAI